MIDQSRVPPGEESIAASLKEKLDQFSATLTSDELNFLEVRLKQAATSAAMHPDISAPVYLVINNSSHPLVVSKVDTSGDFVKSHLFEGSSPKVGDVIQPGARYGFTWIEYFFGSNCDITVEAQDGSGSAMTSTGMNMISGWGYGCRFSKGSLSCGQPGTDHPTWNGNVEIIDS